MDTFGTESKPASIDDLLEIVREERAKQKVAEATAEAERAKRKEAEATAEEEKAKRKEAVATADVENAQRAEAEAKRAEAEAKRAEAEAKRAEAEVAASMANGTYFLHMSDLYLEETVRFDEIPVKALHGRPTLWQRLITPIPETSLEHKPENHASVPSKVKTLQDDVFGCPKTPMLGNSKLIDEFFPAAHILAQGNVCRELLKPTIEYLCGGEKLTEFQMQRPIFGYERAPKANATLEYCVFQQPYNYILLREQFVVWEKRNAAIFLPEKSWLEQLNWNVGEEYSAFFLALTA